MKKYLLLAIVFIAQSNIKGSGIKSCYIDEIVASDGKNINRKQNALALDYFINNSSVVKNNCLKDVFKIAPEQKIYKHTLENLHKLSNNKLPVEKVFTRKASEIEAINDALLAAYYLNIEPLMRKLASYIAHNQDQLEFLLQKNPDMFNEVLFRLSLSDMSSLQSNHKRILEKYNGQA